MLNNIVHPIDVDISFLDNKPYMISDATVVYFGVNIKILNNVFDFFELSSHYKKKNYKRN
jgi:hypothetical protein